MPFEFEVDESTRIVRSRAWGELTDAELLAHLERLTDLFERGVADSAWGHLADFTEVQGLNDVTASCVRQMAERNPWPRESTRVLVVPSDLKYGLGRMYQILGEPKTEGLVLARSAAEAEECFKKARDDCSEAS